MWALKVGNWWLRGGHLMDLARRVADLEVGFYRLEKGPPRPLSQGCGGPVNRSKEGAAWDCSGPFAGAWREGGSRRQFLERIVANARMIYGDQTRETTDLSPLRVVEGVNELCNKLVVVSGHERLSKEVMVKRRSKRAARERPANSKKFRGASTSAKRRRERSPSESPSPEAGRLACKAEPPVPPQHQQTDEVSDLAIFEAPVSVEVPLTPEDILQQFAFCR